MKRKGKKDKWKGEKRGGVAEIMNSIKEKVEKRKRNKRRNR